MNEITFESEDISWRKQGYHLESAMQYTDAGDTRYAGMWVQYAPYLRFQKEDLGIDELVSRVAAPGSRRCSNKSDSTETARSHRRA